MKPGCGRFAGVVATDEPEAVNGAALRYASGTLSLATASHSEVPVSACYLLQLGRVRTNTHNLRCIETLYLRVQYRRTPSLFFVTLKLVNERRVTEIPPCGNKTKTTTSI